MSNDVTLWKSRLPTALWVSIHCLSWPRRHSVIRLLIWPHHRPQDSCVYCSSHATRVSCLPHALGPLSLVLPLPREHSFLLLSGQMPPPQSGPPSQPPRGALLLLPFNCFEKFLEIFLYVSVSPPLPSSPTPHANLTPSCPVPPLQASLPLLSLSSPFEAPSGLHPSVFS